MNEFVKKWVEENYPDAYRTHDGISVEDIVTDFSAALVGEIEKKIDDPDCLVAFCPKICEKHVKEVLSQFK